MKEKKDEKKRWKWWKIVLIILVIFWLLSYMDSEESEKKDIELEVYEYGSSCDDICDSECYDNDCEYGEGYPLDGNYGYEYTLRYCECFCEECR